MRCKRILAAAVSVVMAAGQFSVGAFADDSDENSNAAAFSADDETTMEQDVILLNAEPNTYSAGDVNGDGKINVTDIIKIAAHIKSTKLLSGKGLAAADVNGDNVVNVTDITMIAAHIKGKRDISVYNELPIVKNPREKQTDVTLIEFNVDKNTKTVSWNAAADMKSYTVEFTNGDKTKTTNTSSTSASIPYDMFKDGKLTVTITPSRQVKTEDGTRTYDYGDTIGYLLKIKPGKISGNITVTDDNGKAKIDWKAADFAAGYHVYDITNTTTDGKPKLIADTDTDQLITDFPTSGTVKLLIVPFNSVGEAEGANAEMTKGSTKTDPVADLAAPTFSSYYYNSDTTTATLMWNAVSGAEGYEASIQIDGKWKAYDAKTARNYKFTGLAQGTGFKTRVRAYKTVNGQKAYGKYSTTVTVITDAYVKCVTATPIYASQSTGSTKLGNLSVGDTVVQTDLPTNGWTKIFLPNSNGTKVGYVPTSCLSSNTNTDPVADLAAPTFNSYYYNSDTTTATLMWNAVSGAQGYEASIQIDGKWVAYNTTNKSYKFTNLAQGTGFKTRVRAYKTVNGQKAYGKYSTTVTVITDAYVKCVTATPIYASQSTGSTKLGNLSVGDTVLQTDLPTNGWTKIFLPNSNGTQVGYVPTSCLSSNTNTDPVADLAAPTFSSYYYNSDTTTATLMWNAVSGAEGYEASIQIDGKWKAYDAKTARNYKFTGLAQGTGFKTRVRAYKTVNGQKAYGKYSTTVTVITDAYVKCVTATPIYASQSTGSTKLGNLSVGDTVLQTDLPTNGWTKIFLPNSNGTQVGYVPTSCLSSNTNTDPVADLAAPTFSSYYYNSDTTTATLMWNAVSGAEGYEASIQIDGKWVAYNTTNKSYKFTNLAQGTGFKTRVRAYKTVNGQKAYGKYSTTVTVITDAYVKCVTATPIYASQSTGSTKLGNLSVGDTVLQTDLPTNGWTKIFLPNSNGTQVGYVPTSCLSSNTNTDPVADLAAPTFSSYYYNSDTTTATLMWNAVSGAEGYEASIQIDGKWVAYNTTNKSYKFTGLAQGTGFKTRVRAYKTVNGQKAYGKYSTTVTVITDAYVKCVTATPIYASQSTGSTKIGNLSVGDTIVQTDLPTNGWTKIFLPNSNGTQVGYVPTSCLSSNTNTDPVADLAAPTFSSYFYNSDTTTATLMWNAVSGAEGYEASIQIDGKWVAYDAKAYRNYKFTNLAQGTGFKTRVRAYKTVNGQKAYGKYSTTVTVITDAYVKCVTATPIYASQSTGSTKLGNLSVGDTVLQTDLPTNGWTKIFLPNSNGTQVGYVPTSCLSSNTSTDPVADLAAPTFSSYYYNSDTTTATLMWNAVSGAQGYEASIQIDGKWKAYDAKTARNYKFTGLASRTGFKTRVRAYKTVNGQKAYSNYSTVVTVITDGYVKCVTATPIYASANSGSSKIGNLSKGDIVLQTDLPSNGWTKIFLPNSNGTKVGYIPTSSVKNYSNSALTVISQDGYLGGSPAVLGCEETALASVLNYQFGINVSKNTLIDYYMPEQAFSNGTINVDPNYCFWGSPYHMEGSVGYGCYAPLVAQSAHQYLKYIGVRNNYNIALYTDYYTGNNVNNLKFDPSKLDLGNTTVSGGLDLYGLKAEIDKGNNPIVWYSEIEPYAVCTQTLTAGQTYTNPGSGTYNFTWYGRQHTVVLTGYDDANNCFIIGNVENFNTSSYYGVSQTVSYDFFMSTYTTLGRQSVVITKK